MPFIPPEWTVSVVLIFAPSEFHEYIRDFISAFEGCPAFEIELTNDYDNAHIHMQYGPHSMARPNIGRTYVTRDKTHNRIMGASIDILRGLKPWELQSVIPHELGHAIGLCHSRDGESLMYPFVTTVTKVTPDMTAAICDYDVDDAFDPTFKAGSEITCGYAPPREPHGLLALLLNCI